MHYRVLKPDLQFCICQLLQMQKAALLFVVMLVLCNFSISTVTKYPL